MLTGEVVKFDAGRGFGFIRPDSGQPDVFVHVKDVRAGGIDSLAIGDRLEFLIEESRTGKMRAVDIRRISVAPLAARAA